MIIFIFSFILIFINLRIIPYYMAGRDIAITLNGCFPYDS